MGVEKETLRPGNGTDFPQHGDKVAINYTGCLYDTKAAKHNMGKEFDSSKSRGPLETTIGAGEVIKGWDEGVPQMSLGEKAILTISGDYAYGEKGFPGLIPPNAGLVFEVELIRINDKSVQF
ncbi:FKBP-type peptidyl-prolyl cis-trans isomerase [Aspergillus clavatus NRRL 1]|uniref:peptidylprolyl isomerase n=1 Tax=Aspergillus clavatus (strain ATCC 1007 / CBS 513.65 / DSM 816 / NCTC 3887 / NRRL 1 / QM 1276 / 107) TaxID=344612 RepID=A1C969_ASPCL|nr:FKBP-type peptidyl-prolyl isomerase, putative [Aspergillus clavatus NRRL 1]EAW13393.1 FKBP-type peptidyl-prolyl isomerase, putative [Aspergillus clavatus NRRL 1]